MLVVVVQPVPATLPVAVVEVVRIQAFTEAQRHWQSPPVVVVEVVAVTRLVILAALVALVAERMVSLGQHLVLAEAVAVVLSRLVAQAVPVGQMMVRQVAH